MKQLQRMRPLASLADIIIADGHSTDGSTNVEFLKEMGIRSLLITTEEGLCTATRMGVAYAMEQGYDGVITLDGNGKDGVEALPNFIQGLDEGYDVIQGSRFIKDGEHKNTPLDRYIGIKLLVSPLIALGGGYRYTDPTNAFRALSMRFLNDPRVQPIRSTFVYFNLQIYFLYRAAALKFRVKEIPVVRKYPNNGIVPTKCGTWRKKSLFVKELFCTVMGRYNPQ